MDNFKSSILIAVFTFFIAFLVTLSSQTRVQYVNLLTALITLVIIILIGIIFDMIGVAATVARKKTFNARAAKKVFGAKQGLYLARHGDRVASFMCDIIGDICGTVSGAIGAVIVIKIIIAVKKVTYLILVCELSVTKKAIKNVKTAINTLLLKLSK